MKIRKFEDLESWKKARQLTNAVYKATATGNFARDFGLKDQSNDTAEIGRLISGLMKYLSKSDLKGSKYR